MAVEITMSSVKIKTLILRDKFGVNQHDKVLCKQQSLGLRLKKLFPNEEIIEKYSALHYRTYLVVEIDSRWKRTCWQSSRLWKGNTKELKKIDYHLIRINPDEIDFNDYEQFGRVSAYIAESIKKQTEKSTRKLLIHDLWKRLLKLEFKSNCSIKSKCLKWIVKKILPKI